MSGECEDCGAVACPCDEINAALNRAAVSSGDAEIDSLRAELSRYARAFGGVESAIGYAGSRPLEETVTAVADMRAELARLCQCRRPEAGRDGHTCHRCDDVAEGAALREALRERDAELARVTKERDALKAGKWAGAWRWDDTGEWCSRHRPNEDVHTVELAMRGTGFMWRFRFEAGKQAGSLDAAKAAADAHLIANGWYLADGGE